MDKLKTILRSVTLFMWRRTFFLLLGGGIGYAYGYHHADMGEPSLYRRLQSLVGVDDVRDDHIARQRAIDAFRQARADSIEAAILPH